MKNLKLFEVACDEPFLNEEKIINGLKMLLDENEETGNRPLRDYLYILHDKDVYSKERIEELQKKFPNEERYKKLKVGDKRPAHWHVYLRFNYGVSFEFVAKAFDVNVFCVEKVISRFANCLNYATHNTEEAKKEHKYLYDDSECKSNFAWKTERDIAIQEEHRKNRKNEIRELIVNGTIRKFNYTEYITAEEMDIYQKTIDNAFKYRLDKIRKEQNRNMECIFITGDAGTYKTTYAKKYAEKLGYSYYISSGSNDVLDGYGGQDCLILDDLRPSCMGLNDLLKMIDNNTSSSVKSRYYNKVLECKLVIITTVLSLEDFFKNVFTEQKEPIKQLQRRCKTKIRMDNEYIYMSFYDEQKEKYTSEFKTRNTFSNLYQKGTYNSDEEIKNRMKDFLINDMEIIEDKADNEIVDVSSKENIEVQFKEEKENKS